MINLQNIKCSLALLLLLTACKHQIATIPPKTDTLRYNEGSKYYLTYEQLSSIVELFNCDARFKTIAIAGDVTDKGYANKLCFPLKADSSKGTQLSVKTVEINRVHNSFILIGLFENTNQMDTICINEYCFESRNKREEFTDIITASLPVRYIRRLWTGPNLYIISSHSANANKSSVDKCTKKLRECLLYLYALPPFK